MRRIVAPIAALGALWLVGSAGPGTTWHVDVNGTPPGDGSPGNPYASIQHAIDQATTVDGDIVLVAPGTYVETDVEFTQTVTHEWNHGLGEIVTSLLEAGMELTGLVEHDRVPYEALPGQMVDVGGGEWRLKDRPERLPHTYTLQAVKAGID